MHPVRIGNLRQNICNQTFLPVGGWQRRCRAGYLLHAFTGADVIDVIGKVCGRGVFEVVAA